VARSSVELIVDASKAINPLKRVTSETKKLESSVVKAQSGIRRTNRAFKETGRVAERASKGVNKLGGAIRGLVAGFGAFQAGKFIIFKTAELERQTKSLEVLTGSLGNARNIIAELQQFGAVTPFTSAELIETAKRLKAFGFETKQIVDVTKRLADVAGATGADLGGIATAFGQIQAKGRLQGEELLQLQERGVGLQDELQKMYGLTADEFRKALEGGRISADAVNLALQNITETGGKYANGAIAQSDTLSGKFSTLVDQIERVARTIGEVLTPALKGALSFAIQTVDSINQAFAAASITEQQKQGFKLEAEQEVMRFAGPMPGGPFGAGEVVVRHLGKTYKGSASSVVSQITNDLINQEVQRRVTDARGPGFTPVAMTEPPALLNRTSSTGSGRGSGRDPLKAAKEIAKMSAERVRSLKQQTLLASALTSEERTQFEQQIQIADILENTKGLTGDQLRAELEATVALHDQQNTTAAINRANAQRKEDEDDLVKKLREQQNTITELDRMYESIGQSISTGIVDALSAAVDGTKALADVAADTLRNIANILLQFGVNTALGGIPGLSAFFPGRAKGGTVAGGRSYMVGEKGPELFTPGRSGSIAPSGSFGGANVVVNVDASGTQAQGDQSNAKALGAAIGAAVQAELVKQKRPGGLLS
jgi:tape measure domain-containing protein